MKIRAVLTGATGMVGEGVLHECLLHDDVEHILVINRKPCGLSHPKLKEIIIHDFFDLSSIKDQLAGYQACFFCLGVSSVGMKEEEYKRLTYDLTLYFAEQLLALNPGLVFCYISASGSDRTEHGKTMWARIRGKTENHLLKLPFKKAYMFRIGYVQPTPGLKNAHKWYAIFSWLYPVWRLLLPKYVSTLKEVGLAMVNSVNKGNEEPILEARDIVNLAKL
ncbi:epimerase [Paenibacillus eucommiae]|uniref:Uncharacterized protein YbjT (DUF2867 family) n=1 Tax=Paenibacillus eucommiae TaxID=1355755 RepID=A0ABS4IXS1_9BACL|nr:epimerase [Paenibacillus eucommiae]MBP1991786.1 uncharacterized protein YbjT (DUF2867 family) [Paenibacillus eucommiae]